MNHPKLPNFKFYFFPNHQLFCDKFQLHIAKNIELSLDCLIFISSLLPNLAKLTYGWSPLKLHHKIHKKKIH